MNHHWARPSESELALERLSEAEQAWLREEEEREAYWETLEEDFLEGLVGQPREDERAAHEVRGSAGGGDS